MKTSRRGFLKISASSIIGYSALSSPLFESVSQAASGFSGRVPVCQHMTNAHCTQLSILTEGNTPYAYKVYDSQGRSLACQIYDHDFRKSYHQGIDKLLISGLDPELTYYLQILDKNRGTVLDERIFKSLNLSSGNNLRFALASCASDFYKTHARVMWDLMFAQKPDMIFIIGDAVYADFECATTETEIWRRYCETRSRLRHFRQPNLIPTLATWDDHDYGHNNACRNFKLKNATKRIFDLFFGSRETEGFKRTQGVGSVFTGFGQRFFFLDDRYFRDEAQTGGLMWGSDQQEQFIESVCENSKPAWIFNGSQYFSSYYKQESFMKDYGKNFIDVMAKLRKCPAPVVFGSGDVHFSEVLAIEPQWLGYRTYEYTSSAIHSFNFPMRLIAKNPRREEFSWHHNFMIINSTTRGRSLQVQAQAINARGRVEFSHQAMIKRS